LVQTFFVEQDGLIKLAFFPFDIYEYNFGTPQTALNIGLACGVTSKALSDNLETTTIEIDPVVVEASKFFYENIDHHLIIDDARNWLLRNDEKFDIITTEPSDPYYNNGMLFTKEFFALLNSKLTENGVVAQWVPLYEMYSDDVIIFLDTFHSVFPYVYVYQMQPGNIRELILIGSQKLLELPESNAYMFSYKNVIDENTVLNTDDRPLIEFATAINLYNRDPGRVIDFGYSFSDT